MTADVSLNFSEPLDAVSEDLDIEFKRTLSLKENEGKAKLAREICALSNHGGGWIVLGREDDGTYPNTLPDELVGADQDTINQIASTYLRPAPHCSVSWTQPADLGFKVLVVWVSPLGTSPVCGLKNGPNSEASNKTIGIKKGVHYIRKAGPVSAPIETPDEWQSVIRRCVLSDKSALLGALTTMMDQPQSQAESEGPDIFDLDLKSIVDKWKKCSAGTTYDIDLSRNFVCYGFQLIDSETHELSEIKKCLRSTPTELRRGYRFFDYEYNPPNDPKVIESSGHAGFEVSAMKFDHPFIWRLSEALTGIHIMSYWEDTLWIKQAVERNSSRTWDRGTNIWINQQIRYTNNFLGVIHHIADYFDYRGDIRVHVSFNGLSGRNLNSADAAEYYSVDYSFHQDTKLIDLKVEKSALEPEVRSSPVATIIQSMNKLSQGPTITAERVVHAINKVN